MIVIDLRDTLSVGPVIALLDAALDFLFPAFDYSIVSRTTDRTVNMLRAAPIKTVGLVTLVSTTVLLPLAVIAIDSSIAVVIAGVGVVLIAALGTQIEMSWDEVVETRAVRLIIALLEPPSPPEQNSEHNATADISLTTDQRTSETESED